MRAAFKAWNAKVGDRANIPEKEMIKQMWLGKNEPPATDIPQIIKTAGGIKLACTTDGASIGYRVIRKGEQIKPVYGKVQSWDFGAVFHVTKNGDKKLIKPA